MKTSSASAHHTHNRNRKNDFSKNVKVTKKMTGSKKDKEKCYQQWKRQWWEVVLGRNKRRTCNAITCFSNLSPTFSSFVKFRLFMCDWLLSTSKREMGNEWVWQIELVWFFSSSDNTEVKVSYLNSSEWHFYTVSDFSLDPILNFWRYLLEVIWHFKKATFLDCIPKSIQQKILTKFPQRLK